MRRILWFQKWETLWKKPCMKSNQLRNKKLDSKKCSMISRKSLKIKCSVPQSKFMYLETIAKTKIINNRNLASLKCCKVLKVLKEIWMKSIASLIFQHRESLNKLDLTNSDHYFKKTRKWGAWKNIWTQQVPLKREDLSHHLFSTLNQWFMSEKTTLISWRKRLRRSISK